MGRPGDCYQVPDCLDAYDEVWPYDAEFRGVAGDRPEVICYCAIEMRTGRKVKLWADELGEQPPWSVGDNSISVSFVANAELACDLALGWPLPRNVLDLNPVFRNLTNGISLPEGKGLIGMLRHFGLDTISAKHKDVMRSRILQGPPFTPEEQERIKTYCLGDVEDLARALPHIMPKVDLRVALYHGESVAALALMTHNGVPVDTEIFSLLADPQIWREIRDEMVPEIDAAFGVYVDTKAGWSFSMERWRAYLARERIDWPARINAKGETVLDMRTKTFENMSKGLTQLEPLRQLRHARNKMRKIKLAIGRDARNRTTLWPCKSITGRTQPKASEWIFSPAVWLRSLIKPGPGMAIAYVDYSAMEFLIAASLSDGHIRADRNRMLDMYNSGDPYLMFAKETGALPEEATKKSHQAERELYKVMMLSAQYSLSVASLALKLKISEAEAQHLLRQHRDLFRQYWRWSDDYVQHALQVGEVRTVFDWRHLIGRGRPDSPINERSIANWPIQATGSEILRIACIMAKRRGLRILAPIHDAVLIEAPIDRIEADTALMREIMRRASRVVLNATADGTHELRTDAKIVRYPDRYGDSRGDKIWAHVVELLEKHKRERSDRREESAQGSVCESATVVDRASV